jgi:segregation and condensation protein A
VLSPEQVVVPVVYGQQVPDEVVPLADGDLEHVEVSGFQVRLANFEGPFDLLLQLIGKHKLDVTEVALHQVTDDFIAYIRAMGDEWDLGEASEFLLVAATLLDLKAARLLPSADVEDEEDLALLEARDLLFARLLQYKAYKEAAAFIADLEGTGARRWPRAVSMEPRYAEALPDLVLGIGPERLFKLALKQFTPKPGPPEVSISHIHQMRVSVPEHALLLRERLRRAGSATFSLLIADCENTLEVVARFLALLELYRQNLIDFEQPVSLDELTVRWIGGDDAADELEIDDYEGSRPDPDAPPAESVTEADLIGGALALDEDLDDLDDEDDDLAALLDAAERDRIAVADRAQASSSDDSDDEAPFGGPRAEALDNEAGFAGALDAEAGFDSAPGDADDAASPVGAEFDGRASADVPEAADGVWSAGLDQDRGAAPHAAEAAYEDPTIDDEPWVAAAGPESESASTAEAEDNSLTSAGVSAQAGAESGRGGFAGGVGLGEESPADGIDRGDAPAAVGGGRGETLTAEGVVAAAAAGVAGGDALPAEDVDLGDVSAAAGGGRGEARAAEGDVATAGVGGGGELPAGDVGRGDVTAAGSGGRSERWAVEGDTVSAHGGSDEDEAVSAGEAVVEEQP